MDLIKLSRISFKHLSALHVMLSTHSVTKTAQLLCVSPSSISKTLSQLRRLLDDELFYRDGTRLIPTPFAIKIGPTIHGILNSINGLVEQGAFEPLNYSGRFRLSMRESTFEIFAHIISELVSIEAPNASLQIHAKEQLGLAGLLSGELDFMVLPHDKSQPPTHDKQLVWQTVLDDQMICLMRPSHPLANQQLTISDYLSFKHINIFDNELNQPYFEHILKQQHQPRTIAMAVADFGSAALMCHQSDLLFTCSKRWAKVAMQAQGLVSKALPFDYGNVVYSVVWHQPSLNDQAMKWLQQRLLSLTK